MARKNNRFAGNSDEEEELEQVFTPGGLFPNSLFFEQIKDNQYVVWDWKGEHLLKESCVNYDKIYTPLERVPWPLCKDALEYDTIEQLWQEIRDFIYEHLYLPDKNLYDVLTAWVIATWTPELWTVVPYIFFHGPVGSGKTRGLEVLHRLCYRGILSSNISSAALFRACEEWHPTVILDETEIYNVKERGDIIGLLNSGYRRGQYAIRAKNTEQGILLEVCNVFGYKALAGTKSLRATLESRCIPIHMIKARRKVRLCIDEAKAHSIRCKLLMYRMKTLHIKRTKETLTRPVEAELSELSELFLERVPQLNFADGRLQELFQSLLAVSNHGQENVLKYAEKMAEMRRFEEMASEEAELVNVLLNSSSIIENNVILTKDLTERFNANRNEGEKWKTRSIGWLMRRLGFEKRHTFEGNGWLIDAGLLESLKQIYVGDTTPPGKSSKTSESSALQPTAQEIIEKVRSRLTSSFEENKLVDAIVAVGTPREEAEKHVQFLIDKEMIGRDDVGLWHWTVGRA